MDDKNGKWVTINGTHIFIKDGQTIEEAFADKEQTSKAFTDAVINRVDTAQLDPRNWYYIGEEKVSPRKYARYKLEKALGNRAINDPIIIEALKNHIDTVILKDTRGSHNDWLNGKRRLVVSIAGTAPETCTTFFHEVGHAIDYDKQNYEFMSNTFVSPKHNKTLVNMLLDEFGDIDIELLKDEYGRFHDLGKKVSIDYQDDRISKDEFFRKGAYLNKAVTDFIDMIQGVFGENAAMDVGGWLPHKKGYFLSPSRLGTECFAELTESLHADKEKSFYNLIKQYCPKTVEIYEEIMEERRKQWKIDTTK